MSSFLDLLACDASFWVLSRLWRESLSTTSLVTRVFESYLACDASLLIARTRCTCNSCAGHDMRLGKIKIAHTLVGQAPGNAWFQFGQVDVMRVPLEVHLVTSPNWGFLTYIALVLKDGGEHIYKTWDIYAQHVLLAWLDGAWPSGNIIRLAAACTCCDYVGKFSVYEDRTLLGHRLSADRARWCFNDSSETAWRAEVEQCVVFASDPWGVYVESTWVGFVPRWVRVSAF